MTLDPPPSLHPFEIELLEAGRALQRRGTSEFSGFQVSKLIEVQSAPARRIIGFGTLYRALDHLEELGLLRGRWEEPEIAEAEQRPRRRLFALTASGEQVLNRLPVMDAERQAP